MKDFIKSIIDKYPEYYIKYILVDPASMNGMHIDPKGQTAFFINVTLQHKDPDREKEGLCIRSYFNMDGLDFDHRSVKREYNIDINNTCPVTFTDKPMY